MKLAFRQIEPFVKKPDATARAILIYGPEAGLMKERSKIIGQSVVADLNDPFNAVTLPGGALAGDPARLMDEAMAQSFLGGARLIRIEDGGDALAPLLKDYLAAPSAQNLVIVEAGELGPRSALRLLFEKADNAAALPCYVEEERDVAGLIREEMTGRGIAVSREALSFLAGALAGDRRRIRSELEKLALYKHNDPAPVSLEDAQQCCGDSGAQNLDSLVHAVAGSQPETARRAFAALMREGLPVIVVLRALQGHFRRLHLVKARQQGGEPLDVIMKTLQPPVFFKQEPAFRGQVSSWSAGGLARALERLAALEAQCKKTGMPDETLCAQALLALSRKAA